MRILIAGYYGFGNLGDELVLSSVLSQLRERYDNAAVTVLSANPSETFSYHRVRAVSRWNLFSVISEIWKNDFLILGGGGLLQNKTSNRSLVYYLSLMVLARLLQSPVVLFAMGVESIEGSWLRQLTKKIVSSPNVTITVRDEVSKQILSEIGVPASAVHITADPVFARSGGSAPRERYSLQNASALLIPRFPCPAEGRTLFAVAGRVLRDEKKMRVRGLLFQPQVETGYLNSFNGETILGSDDFINGLSLDEMAAQVGRFDWVISARFHGLVLAALAGRPFIGVGDPHKIARLCHLMKMPFLSWNSGEAEIKAAIDRMSLKSIDSQNGALDRLRAAALQTTNHIG